MLKTKARFKLLLALGIMILAISVFNVSTVNAATQEELQAMLDVIPDKITLDITELEAGMDYKKGNTEVEKKIKEIWKENNISIEGIEIEYWGGLLYSNDNFHQGGVRLQNDTSKQKTFSLAYSNSSQKNSADEQAVKNIKVKSPKYHEITLELTNKILGQIAGEMSEGQWNIFINHLNSYYSKLSKDTSIKIIATAGSGGSGGYLNMTTESTYVGIFKNGILYEVKYVGNDVTVPVINVPSTVVDSELNNYIINAIKEYYPDYASKITKIENGSTDEPFSNIPNIYTITSNTEINKCYIIVKTAPKITLDNQETNIKLETSEGVIPSNTILEVASITEGTTYNTVKTALTNISKFKVFDINLLSDGVKIQPNGKVKISIPVPAEFDKSNLVVYRVEENGDKIEYTVTVNGDVATFETDHFSTYVLAEKEITENTSNTTDRKKDDTPKTGTISSIYFMIPVAIISATGIIAFRRKETK